MALLRLCRRLLSLFSVMDQLVFVGNRRGVVRVLWLSRFWFAVSLTVARQLLPYTNCRYVTLSVSYAWREVAVALYTSLSGSTRNALIRMESEIMLQASATVESNSVHAG